MKKAVTFAAIMILFVSLASCSSKKDIPQSTPPQETEILSSSQEDFSGKVSQAENAEARPQSGMDTTEEAVSHTFSEEQLQLIADHASVWMGDTELTAEPFFYAVTDFDQNGQLEIVQSSCQGTGLFTYTQMWEVSADKTELTPCRFAAAEGDSQPDIITNPDAVYYDEAKDCYYYLFCDTIRNGAAEHYQNQVAFSLQDGVVTTTLLAQSHSIYTNAGSKEEITYTDANGNSIDEEAYNAAAAQAFSGRKAMKAEIGWTDYDLSAQLAALTKEEILAILEASWEKFTLV